MNRTTMIKTTKAMMAKVKAAMMRMKEKMTARMKEKARKSSVAMPTKQKMRRTKRMKRMKRARATMKETRAILQYLPKSPLGAEEKPSL